MKLIETYVTVHDQDLILECEAAGQFDQLSSHTYLFVGPRPVDRVPADVKIVVARDHVPNIEHWPQLYDFTGWLVLAKHGLIDAKYVMFLQYDMHVNDPHIEVHCVRKLAERPGPVAFTAGHHLAGNFMLMLSGFEQLYRQAIGLRGVNMNAWPAFNEWPTTQGTAWRTDRFTGFMLWVEPMLSLFAPEVWAGHFAERTVKAWASVSEREHYLPGVITHLTKDCHGTGALMRSDHALYNQRNAEFRNQSS